MKNKLVVVLLYGGVIFLTLHNFSYAQHECQGGHNCNDDGSVIAIDNSSGVSTSVSDSSRAFGIGGNGDVDINDCRYSVQGPLSQWTRPNHWCEAEKLIAIGFFEAGILMFCTKTTVKDLYASTDSCLLELRQGLNPVQVPVLAAEPPEIAREHEEIEESHERYDDRFAQLEEQISTDRAARQLAARRQQEKDAIEKSYWQDQAKQIAEWKSADQQSE
jgi:hypothetical protein